MEYLSWYMYRAKATNTMHIVFCFLLWWTTSRWLMALISLRAKSNTLLNLNRVMRQHSCGYIHYRVCACVCAVHTHIHTHTHKLQVRAMKGICPLRQFGRSVRLWRQNWGRVCMWQQGDADERARESMQHCSNIKNNAHKNTNTNERDWIKTPDPRGFQSCRETQFEQRRTKKLYWREQIY